MAQFTQHAKFCQTCPLRSKRRVLVSGENFGLNSIPLRTSLLSCGYSLKCFGCFLHLIFNIPKSLKTWLKRVAYSFDLEIGSLGNWTSSVETGAAIFYLPHLLALFTMTIKLGVSTPKNLTREIDELPDILTFKWQFGKLNRFICN